jgi:hypothetical protein
VKQNSIGTQLWGLIHAIDSFAGLPAGHPGFTHFHAVSLSSKNPPDGIANPNDPTIGVQLQSTIFQFGRASA